MSAYVSIRQHTLSVLYTPSPHAQHCQYATHTCIYVCMSVWMDVCNTYVSYVCVCVCVCVCVYVCVCMHVCMYAFMYISMYIYAHTHTHSTVSMQHSQRYWFLFFFIGVTFLLQHTRTEKHSLTQFNIFSFFFRCRARTAAQTHAEKQTNEHTHTGQILVALVCPHLYLLLF